MDNPSLRRFLGWNLESELGIDAQPHERCPRCAVCPGQQLVDREGIREYQYGFLVEVGRQSPKHQLLQFLQICARHPQICRICAPCAVGFVHLRNPIGNLLLGISLQEPGEGLQGITPRSALCRLCQKHIRFYAPPLVGQCIKPEASTQGLPSIYCLGIWPKVSVLMMDQSPAMDMVGEVAIDGIDSAVGKDDIMKNGEEPLAGKQEPDVWPRVFSDAFHAQSLHGSQLSHQSNIFRTSGSRISRSNSFNAQSGQRYWPGSLGWGMTPPLPYEPPFLHSPPTHGVGGAPTGTTFVATGAGICKPLATRCGNAQAERVCVPKGHGLSPLSKGEVKAAPDASQPRMPGGLSPTRRYGWAARRAIGEDNS